MNINRKTTIPLKAIPEIIEWLLRNASKEELEFMIALAQDRRNFSLLNSIFTKLTEYNVYQVFYTQVASEKELFAKWSAKRGEVAGLKAFSMACQAAITKREEKKVKRAGEKHEKAST